MRTSVLSKLIGIVPHIFLQKLSHCRSLVSNQMSLRVTQEKVFFVGVRQLPRRDERLATHTQISVCCKPYVRIRHSYAPLTLLTHTTKNLASRYTGYIAIVCVKVCLRNRIVHTVTVLYTISFAEFSITDIDGATALIFELLTYNVHLLVVIRSTTILIIKEVVIINNGNLNYLVV